MTLDVSCVVIGIPNHVVYLSHVLCSEVNPYVGGAVGDLQKSLRALGSTIKEAGNMIFSHLSTSLFTTLSVCEVM